MLTNRGDDGTPPSRTDEVTGSLGYAVIDGERDEDLVRPLLVLGAGGRAYGDLGGESIQNEVHRTFGYKTVHLPPDPEAGLAAFAFYHGRLTAVPPWDYQFAGPFGSWAFQIESGGLASTVGEVQLYGSANLVSRGRDSMAWVGTRYQWNGGHNPTDTSTIVADRESGWWVVVGLSRSPGVLVTASINPDRETVAGSVGFTVDHALAVREGPAYRVEQALKFFPHGGNLGVDVRWQPTWLAEHSLSERDSLVMVYDFGRAADYDWQDCEVAFDQLILGWAPWWEIPQPIPRVTWTAGAYLAGGVRLERVHAKDGSPRFPTGDVKVAAVLQGELGTRLGYQFGGREEAWYNQLRLGLGLDGWLPYPQATVSTGADSEDYLLPGYSLHVTIGTTVKW
jgi:hypothetical protein